MDVEGDTDNYLSLADLVKEKDNEIARLRKLIEENNKSLVKAGEYGQNLMQRNSSLEEMIENIQIEHGKVIEEYEQKTYSLENKLEVLTKMKAQVESNLQDESQRWKKEIEHMKQQADKKLTDANGQLNSKLEDVTNQLQQEKLISTQRLETLELKEGQIQKLNKDIKNLQTSLNDTMSTEVAELTNENCELKSWLQEAENTEHELTQRVQQLKDSVEILTNNERSLRQAKEDANRETCDYYNRLEECREECRELQAELDMVNLQSGDPNSCGNSLFGEVEDKRIQAEKRLISMKSQYKSMQGQVEQLKHYILKLKMQISALLETRSSSADQAHVRSLGEALSISRSDNNKLLHKLKLLQDKLTIERSDVKNCHSDDQAIDSALVQILKNELKERNREVDRLTEELRLSEIYLINESKKVSDTERELYEKRKQLDVTKAHNFKQQIEIDRLKMKCGEDIRVRTYRHKYKTEKVFQKGNTGPNQCDTETEPKCEANVTEGEGVAVEKQSPLKENVPAAQQSEMPSDHATKSLTNQTDMKNQSDVMLQPLSEKQSNCEKHSSKSVQKTDDVSKNETKVTNGNCNIQTVDRSRIKTADDCKQQ